MSDARFPVSGNPTQSSRSLRGRVALVTGVGRKRGIGSAICRELASRGGGLFFGAADEGVYVVLDASRRAV
ncbi:MAG TPA: hypothetical protein VJ827_13570, partial [Rubrobacter sp.]|nr:hypothetical protein [Rubrobacter sp.]